MAEAKYPKTFKLGSGKFYVAEFDGALPEVDDICIDENLFGLVSGGASMTYSPEFYEASDDLGLAKENILTSEDVTLKTGVCTFNGDSLAKLASTSRVTVDGATKRRTLKLGGIANDNGKSYVVCFAHKNKAGNDAWILLVGRNQSAIELSFAKDKESVVNAEFKGRPMDEEGTLVHYIEHDPSIDAGGE